MAVSMVQVLLIQLQRTLHIFKIPPSQVTKNASRRFNRNFVCEVMNSLADCDSRMVIVIVADWITVGTYSLSE